MKYNIIFHPMRTHSYNVSTQNYINTGTTLSTTQSTLLLPENLKKNHDRNFCKYFQNSNAKKPNILISMFQVFICVVFLATFEATDATPIKIVQTAEGKVYQVRPLGPRVLKLARREVLTQSPKAEETMENGLSVTRWPGNDQIAHQEKKEILVSAFSEADALAVLLRRNRRSYEDGE